MREISTSLKWTRARSLLEVRLATTCRKVGNEEKASPESEKREKAAWIRKYG